MSSGSASTRDSTPRARRWAARPASSVPLVIAWLLARFAFSIDLPDIPWPDLPDLPSVPWPDIALPDWSLPDWSLPGWLQQVLDVLKFVFPVLLAFVIARGEIRRRRKQDELRQNDDQH